MTADFSAATVEEVGPDVVRISGVTGSERPSTLKVLVGVDFGFKAVGEISYGGTGCVERARRAEEIVRVRLEPEAAGIDEIRFDLHGATASSGGCARRSSRRRCGCESPLDARLESWPSVS